METDRSPYQREYFKNNKTYIINKNKIKNYKNKLIKEKIQDPKVKLEKFIQNLMSKDLFIEDDHKKYKIHRKKIVIHFD